MAAAKQVRYTITRRRKQVQETILINTLHQKVGLMKPIRVSRSLMPEEGAQNARPSCGQKGMHSHGCIIGFPPVGRLFPSKMMYALRRSHAWNFQNGRGAPRIEEAILVCQRLVARLQKPPKKKYVSYQQAL